MMKLANKIPLIVVAFTVLTCVPGNPTVAAEWRWARPLNQKPGSMLYTTNRARYKKSSSSYRSRSWRRPSSTVTQPYRRSYSRPVYTTPPVIQQPGTVIQQPGTIVQQSGTVIQSVPQTRIISPSPVK